MMYDIWCAIVNQRVELLIIYPLEELWTMESWKSRFRVLVLYIDSLSQCINLQSFWGSRGQWTPKWRHNTGHMITCAYWKAQFYPWTQWDSNWVTEVIKGHNTCPQLSNVLCISHCTTQHWRPFLSLESPCLPRPSEVLIPLGFSIPLS
jgi:hypothetical protein